MTMKLILEGFWGMGKTEVALQLAANGFVYLPEPDHIGQLPSEVTQETIDRWYVDQHKERARTFLDLPNSDVVMERSCLSSAAYLHAQKIDSENIIPEFFTDGIKSEKISIIFLNAEDSFIVARVAHMRDGKTRSLLQMAQFTEQYRSFFKEILPARYGINTHFVSCNDGSAFRPQSEIAAEVFDILGTLSFRN